MAILRSSSVDSDTSATITGFHPEEIDLGDDLRAEIILRLPLDSVARSRAVSKNWCATISDDYLRRRLPLHMSMICFPDNDDPLGGGGGGGGGSRPLFACADDGRRLVGRDLGFFPLHERAVVCDGCNGLLLCRDPGTPDFYVVSPVTRRWTALPRPAREAQLSLLAFDPFGSSSPQQYYHVINFTGWRDHGSAVEVFSSETRAWTAHEVEFGGVPAGSLSGASMHCHDGAVYFIASDPDCVVRMDLAAELACTVIALPEPADGEGRVAHSGGRLHYVCSDGELLKVWAIKDVLQSTTSATTASRQQWRLKHAVRVGDAVGERDGEVRFLAMHPDKDAVVYLWSPWKVVEYDLSKREATGAAWEFVGKGARNRVVKTWLVPSSCYLSDCFGAGPMAR